VRDLWVELGEGEERVEALRGIDLDLEPGERVALMGRNGAGKSTLLRAAAGLVEPRRGRLEAPRGVGLLPQRPGDLLVRETVGEELSSEAGRQALRLFGLERLEGADPRDLSGGERQRLALAIVVAGRGPVGGKPPGAVLLDEPTRGMDRARKGELADLTGELAEEGAAVLVATHDVEFAATFAERVVLMGRGEVVADGPIGELLAGGWYFSTEVARVLDGLAVTPEEGVRALT
jgi:energy-coupling factor transport system ATP-binding protein